VKKIFVFLLTTVLIFSFVSCGGVISTNNPDEPVVKDDPKPETGNDNLPRVLNLCTGEGYVIEYNGDSYERLMEVSYPVIKLTDDDEVEFPDLNDSFEKLSQTKRKDQVEILEDNKDYAGDFLENTEFGEAAFYSNITPYVRRADTLVTSILTFTNMYLGGAHGNYFYFGRNYDTQSGKELKLTDVVADTDKLVPAIRRQLDKFYSDLDYESFQPLEDIFSDEENVSWTIDYNGISFHFSPYTLASFASGVQSVTLSFDEYPDIVKKEYQAVPSSYGVELLRGSSFYYDTDGDGKLDKIDFSFLGASNDIDSFFSITVNDNELVNDYYFYDANAYFVHTEDNRNYVYVETLGDSDCSEIICYEIKDRAKETGKIWGALRTIICNDNEECGYMNEALTNPDSFYIDNRTDLLSTVTGYREYFVSSNGVPETNDKVRKFEDGHMISFKLLKDFEVDVYDEENDEIKGKKTLKSGEKVLYWATDDIKYGYLKCADGTICRVEGGHDSSYKFKVNGFSIEEVFDGVIFAG